STFYYLCAHLRHSTYVGRLGEPSLDYHGVHWYEITSPVVVLAVSVAAVVELAVWRKILVNAAGGVVMLVSLQLQLIFAGPWLADANVSVIAQLPVVALVTCPAALVDPVTMVPHPLTAGAPNPRSPHTFPVLPAVNTQLFVICVLSNMLPINLLL